jgi:hypothetical protein
MCLARWFAVLVCAPCTILVVMLCVMCERGIMPLAITSSLLT